MFPVFAFALETDETEALNHPLLLAIWVIGVVVILYPTIAVELPEPPFADIDIVLGYSVTTPKALKPAIIADRKRTVLSRFIVISFLGLHAPFIEHIKREYWTPNASLIQR